MPFNARALEEKHARLVLVERMNHELLQPYPVLHEKPIRRQWDPSSGTATTWGQAVFRGTANVMTQGWPERSPSL
jgi:hypothetical protein